MEAFVQIVALGCVMMAAYSNLQVIRALFSFKYPRKRERFAANVPRKKTISSFKAPDYI